jgi:hypothetical protein
VCFIGGKNTAVITSVVDSVNGGWSQFPQGSPVTTGAQDWLWDAWYFLGSAAGTPVITVTYDSSTSERGIVAGSYTGIATANAFDVGAGLGQTDPGTGANAVTTGATSATAVANELAIAAMRVQTSSNQTVGTGYTERFNAALGTQFSAHVEDKNVASAAAVTGTWTIDNAGADTMAIVGTFKEAAVAGAPTLAVNISEPVIGSSLF